MGHELSPGHPTPQPSEGKIISTGDITPDHQIPETDLIIKKGRTTDGPHYPHKTSPLPGRLLLPLRTLPPSCVCKHSWRLSRLRFSDSFRLLARYPDICHNRHFSQKTGLRTPCRSQQTRAMQPSTAKPSTQAPHKKTKCTNFKRRVTAFSPPPRTFPPRRYGRL